MPTAIDDLIAGRGVKSWRWHSDTQQGAPTLSSSGTINHNGGKQALLRVTNGGAVTGIILEKGLFDGQEVVVVNEGANNLTFAADATSNVYDGTNIVVPAKRACWLVWSANLNSGGGLWVAVKSS